MYGVKKKKFFGCFLFRETHFPMIAIVPVACFLLMCICNGATGQHLRTLLSDEGADIDLLSSTRKPSHKPSKKPSYKPSMHPSSFPSSSPVGSGLVIPSEMVAEHNVSYYRHAGEIFFLNNLIPFAYVLLNLGMEE